MRARRAWKTAAIGVALLGCAEDADRPEKPTPATCTDVVDKLTGCGLITGTQLADCVDGDRGAACVTDCVSNASCEQMRAGYCEAAFNGFSGCLNECKSAPPPDYVCSDGSLIPASWRCDGGADCQGGEDEDCPEGSFNCDDGLTVPAAWRCDTVDDCSLGEDEFDCPGSPGLSCNDGTRLPARRQCDGSSDCAEGEDELDCAELTCDP